MTARATRKPADVPADTRAEAALAATWAGLKPLDRWMLLFIVTRDRPWTSTLLGAWDDLAELDLVVVTTVRRPTGPIPAVTYTPEGDRLAQHALREGLADTAEWRLGAEAGTR